MDNLICSHFTDFSVWGLRFVKLQVALLEHEFHPYMHTCPGTFLLKDTWIVPFPCSAEHSAELETAAQSIIFFL